MKPLNKSDDDWMDLGDGVIGFVPVKRPHNEKPVLRFRFRYLRRVVNILEQLNTQEGYLWIMDGPRDNSSTAAFTESRDSNVAVVMCGMVQGGKS